LLFSAPEGLCGRFCFGGWDWEFKEFVVTDGHIG
jgi:hypothetical protein